MKDVIRLSRFTTLKRIKDKTFLIECTLNTVRVNEDSNGTINWIDPPEGPMIEVGRKFGTNKVKSIDHLKGVGFTITFE